MSDASHETGAVISGNDLQRLATAIQMLLEGKDLARFGFVIKGEESPHDSNLKLVVYEIEGLTGAPRLAIEQTFTVGYHRGPFPPQ